MKRSPPSPRVSFVIPLYNELEFTQAMLASLRATLPAALAHEIILVDNGSSDGTRDWLRTLEDAPFRVILNERNLGYAAANNLGVREARGEFIALLNNDLVFLPGWFEPMMEVAAHPGIGIVGNVQLSVRTQAIDHAGMFFDEAGQPFHFRPTEESLASLSVVEAPAVTGACMLLKRANFETLKGFDEGYRNGYEDVDLCMRARGIGLKIVVATHSVVYHYIGASAGRHEADDANAARFQKRWGNLAREISRVKPPVLSTGLGGVAGLVATKGGEGGTRRPAFATLQAFHPGPEGHTEQGSTVHLYPMGAWTRVRVPLPFGVERVRLDPCNFPGMVQTEALELKGGKSGKVVWSAKGGELAEVLAVSGTAVVKPESGQWLTMESNGNDPRLGIRAESIPAELRSRRDLVLEVLIRTRVLSEG